MAGRTAFPSVVTTGYGVRSRGTELADTLCRCQRLWSSPPRVLVVAMSTWPSGATSSEEPGRGGSSGPRVWRAERGAFTSNSVQPRSFPLPSARRRSPLSPGFLCPLCWPAVSASRPLPPTAPAWTSGRHPAWCGGPAVVTGGPSAVLLSAAAGPSLTAWLVWPRLGLLSFDAL